MHVLFIAPTLPIPTSGGRTRLFNLVRKISLLHDVSVLSFLQPGEEEMLPLVRPLCRRLVTIPFGGDRTLGAWHNRLRGWSRILLSRRPLYVRTFPVGAMREPLRALLQSERIDVAVLQHLFVVELHDDLGDVPAVLAEDNVESDIARQVLAASRGPIHRLRDWLVWHKLLAFEKHWVRQFAVCAAVSEADASLLRAMSPQTQVHVVPNGVDGEFFAPPSGDRLPARLLFFGVLSYAANVRGLSWFCEQVLPRVRQVRPDVELEICGLHLTPAVAALERWPGVRVTGFVPDVRPKLWQSTASVVPLHVGGGTRLKILEALAAGCPVVSTSVGAEGLELQHGEHLLIGDSPEQFARCVCDLLAGEDVRLRLSEAGRRAVTERYDWGQIAHSLEAACEQATALCSSR